MTTLQNARKAHAMAHNPSIPAPTTASNATATHTPGPWVAFQPDGEDNPGSKYAIKAPNASVATIHNHNMDGGPGSIAEANARLIAAAPETAAERDELLAKLRACATTFLSIDDDRNREKGSWRAAMREDIWSLIERVEARTTIAKATQL